MTRWTQAGWPPAADRSAQVELHFDAAEDVDCITNVSAAALVGGDTLFLASDEGTAIERLSWDGAAWTGHRRIDLCGLLALKHGDEEMDLEGLAVRDGWLWVLGSHARTRPKPEKAKDECIHLSLLADLKDTRARSLLARLPLVQTGDGWMPVRKDGDRHAGLLKQTNNGNKLGKLLSRDPLIKPFTFIPAKEGGVDLEGIAVCGTRVALGMRGPVITGKAMLVELEVEIKASGKIHLSGKPTFRLLAMEGLGIRDLHVDGNDLLILAGPTTSLSGPCALYRWTNWVNEPPKDRSKVRLHRPERVLELPFGRGVDHPEGIVVVDSTAETPRRLLVLCDSPAKTRLDNGGRFIRADLFDFPSGS